MKIKNNQFEVDKSSSKMQKSIIVWFFVFILSGCGAMINLSKNGRVNSYIRTSNSIFIQNQKKNKKVFLIIKNATSYNNFNNIQKEIKSKASKDIIFVDDESSADSVIYLNIRQFISISKNTFENIEKYWNYFDISDAATIKETNANSFAIIDGQVGVTDVQQGAAKVGGSPQKEDISIISKISKNDFMSGMILGGTIGFWIVSNPIGAVLGGMVGGATSFTAQDMTEPSIYMTVIDLQISQKVSSSIEYNEKYIHKQDDNGMRWHNFKSMSNFNHNRIKMYSIIKRSVLGSAKASNLSSEKIAEAIANMI